MYTQEEMKKVFKEEIYKYGTSPYCLESIGKLIKRDFYGECGYDIIFEKKPIEEAISFTLDNIVNVFTKKVMLDIINKSNIHDIYSLHKEDDMFIINIANNKYTYKNKYEEVVLWIVIMTWIA